MRRVVTRWPTLGSRPNPKRDLEVCVRVSRDRPAFEGLLISSRARPFVPNECGFRREGHGSNLRIPLRLLPKQMGIHIILRH